MATDLVTRMHAAVVARVRAVGVTSFNGGKPIPVAAHWWATLRGNVNPPVIIVTVDDQTEAYRGITSTSCDWIGYPFRVMIAEDLNQGTPDPKKLPWYRAARRGIERAFHNQLLDGVPEVTRVVCEPLPIAGNKYTAYEGFMGGLVVRCVVPEPRGLGV